VALLRIQKLLFLQLWQCSFCFIRFLWLGNRQHKII
jgi:hypothetical protein